MSGQCWRENRKCGRLNLHRARSSFCVVVTDNLMWACREMTELLQPLRNIAHPFCAETARRSYMTVLGKQSVSRYMYIRTDSVSGKLFTLSRGFGRKRLVCIVARILSRCSTGGRCNNRPTRRGETMTLVKIDLAHTRRKLMQSLSSPSNLKLLKPTLAVSSYRTAVGKAPHSGATADR